jgi:hypothetical protein
MESGYTFSSSVLSKSKADINQESKKYNDSDMGAVVSRISTR